MQALRKWQSTSKRPNWDSGSWSDLWWDRQLPSELWIENWMAKGEGAARSWLGDTEGVLTVCMQITYLGLYYIN